MPRLLISADVGGEVGHVAELAIGTAPDEVAVGLQRRPAGAGVAARQDDRGGDGGDVVRDLDVVVVRGEGQTWHPAGLEDHAEDVDVRLLRLEVGVAAHRGEDLVVVVEVVGGQRAAAAAGQDGLALGVEGRREAWCGRTDGWPPRRSAPGRRRAR